MKTRHLRLGLLLLVLVGVIVAPAYLCVQNWYEEFIMCEGDLLLVTDAGTGKPIANAQIRFYPVTFPHGQGEGTAFMNDHGYPAFIDDAKTHDRLRPLPAYMAGKIDWTATKMTVTAEGYEDHECIPAELKHKRVRWDNTLKGDHILFFVQLKKKPTPVPVPVPFRFPWDRPKEGPKDGPKERPKEGPKPP
jgi:hypothetical protein